MSLLKQLFLAICLFLVLAFSGSFLVSVEASREQQLSQLRSHAQDAATALGLSLTPQIDDPAMVELMVSSIFDSGYFASIRVVRISDGSVMVERNNRVNTDPVPAWFVRLVDIPPQGADALVMRGWEQAARVEVVSHPQFALARLWDSALGSLAWLLACGVVSALVGGWLLREQLRPLDAMVRQAQAISRREFLSLPQIPRTPELKRVVQAMNQMVDKLRALFGEEAARSERLRAESYQDAQTGLANRRLLDIRLAEQLLDNEHNGPGYLLSLRVNDLAGLNQRFGGQRTDELIVAIGELLKRLLDQPSRLGWLAARNRGGEFSLLAPGIGGEEAEQLATELHAGLENLHATGASDCTPVAHMGLVAWRPGEALDKVLDHLDQALAQAQVQAPNGETEMAGQPWARLDRFEATAGQGGLKDWSEWLDTALSQRRLRLYFQPVVRCTEQREILQHKVLARLLDPDGEPVAAGQFLPWIERLGWSARLDQSMLEHTLADLAGNPRALALSLSGATLREPASLERLLATLERVPQQARWLTLEIDERHLPPAAELHQLSQRIHAAGYQLGLQHFGGRFSLIGNLTHLGLAYLKIDGGYIRAIDQESDKRMFIEAIYRTTHSIDLPLIAEMVETEGELRVLTEMGIDGAMGRYIGAPAP